MRRTKFSATDLGQLSHQLNAWRQSQSGATRLPEGVWKAAASLSATRSVGEVARALRLDDNKLKARVPQDSANPAPVPSPAFIELRPRESMPQVSAACRVELFDRSGARMTVDLPCDRSTLVGLAQVFWRRGR